MNSKEEILRRTLDHRDYSFESKYNHETSPKKSYYDAPSGYGNKFHEDDVEGLADHELKREREKTRILEERLKNKEIFINQMKEFQKELTRAFDQSQQELTYYKAKCEELSGEELAVCVEEIEQLRQNLAECQEEKRRLEQQLGSKPRSFSKERPPSRSMQRANTDQILNTRDNEQSRDRDTNPLEFAKQFVGALPGFPDGELLCDGSKLGKFISHFLLMVETCNPNVPKQSLKESLKFGWKWIKQVVKNSSKGSSLDRDDKEELLKSICQVTNRKSIGQLLPFIQDALQESRQQSKLIKTITEYYELPENTSLKQLDKFLRERREGHR